MHTDLVELGWTEEHLRRIDAVITEEAQKARVAAQLLSMGSTDARTVAVPSHQLVADRNPGMVPRRTARDRLTIDTDPTLYLMKVAVNVSIRTRDAAANDLDAVLTMFRRAASYVARIEDALVFNGRAAASPGLVYGAGGIPDVFRVTGRGPNAGIFPTVTAAGQRNFVPIPVVAVQRGNAVVVAISRAIGVLENRGYFGPFACALSSTRFNEILEPTANLVLPRDRILPLIQGPLLRASAILPGWGVVVALGGDPLELVVASDIHVKYLQMTEEPRLVFQVAERIGLRIKESAAIALVF